MTRTLRTALLGTVTTTALFAFSSPAAAQSCTISPVANPTSNVTCTAGATTNTTMTGAVTPTNDREYLVTTAGGNASATVNGALTGYGLAITNTVGGANTLTVTNNGGVQIDSGLTATVGGNAALDVSATGATNVNYSGAGDVINLGTTGDGLRIDTNGTGNIVANIGGDLTSAAGGDGVEVVNSGTDGDVTVTTASGTTITADAIGVFGQVTNAASDGVINLTNNATIGSSVGAGTLTHGVAANNYGTGSISITNNGTIGSATDTPGGAGVLGQILNTGSAATVSLTNTGDIYVTDAGVAAYNQGTGGISITNSGDLTSTAAPGIYAEQAGTGTTGTVSVTNSGTIDAATNGIQTSNGGTGGVTITNNGAITADAMGIRARGLNAAATGNIVVQGNGSIDAGTTGIWAPTAGTGNVTVNYTGPITAGGVGVLAEATTGTTTVAVGDVTAAGAGVQAVSTGTQSITANGDVVSNGGAGIHSDTTGNRTITIASTGSVDGSTEAILLTNTGTALIANAGTVGSTSTDVALDAAAAGAVTFNNNAGGTLNGTLMFGAGNDTLANQGTFNTQGTTDFGAGTDVFTNTGSLNLTGATTFTGLETLNLGGTTNLGAFTLNGTGALNNTGTLNSDGGSLLGFTTLSNSGDMFLTGTTTVAAAPFTNSGTIFSLDGDATLTGQTLFTNTGTIDMIDDAADDTLTIDSDFVGGVGSTLAVDVEDDIADMLIVTGDISGTTSVDANILGSGVLVDGGVQVVDGQGASTAGAFTLGDVMGGSALVDYDIVQDGSDYYLDASLNAAGFRPLTLAAAVPDFWYPSADEVIANLAVPYKGGSGVGFWADGYISREKYGDNDVEYSFGGVDYSVDQRVKFGHMGLQAGVDYGVSETGRVGLTGGFSRHNGKGNTDLDAKGWNLGVYGAFGGTTGFHGEALAKYDRYKVDFNDGFFDGSKPKVKAFGIDGSIGYRMPMGGENSSLDFAAGLSHVTSKIDDINAFGLTYDYDRVKSTRGRASARYNIGGELQPYVQATAYHEFADAGRVALFDGVNTFDLETDKRGTWGRIEGGIGGSPNRFPMLAAWADFGDVKGIGARLGMRFGAEGEAAPPPPPPPPPPPVETAPATQTCYDGSVILATDTCPMPPAPPPPPPAPERG